MVKAYNCVCCVCCVCVCGQSGEKRLCGRSVHLVCSCWSELLTVLDRTLVVWYILPYSALDSVTL